MKTENEYPFSITAPAVLVGLYVFFTVLWLLGDILVPVCFSFLIAVLLNPLVMFLMRRRIPKVLAILIAVVLGMLVAGGVVAFISSQLANFSELAPQLKERGMAILASAQHWITDTFNVPKAQQDAVLQDGIDNSKAYIGQTVNTMLGIVSVVILIPIYVFLIMYYKPLFLSFLYDVFDKSHKKQVSDILNQTKAAIQAYMQGLLIETAIVAALNSVALLLLGVDYAILLGIIGGVLNLVPYVGGLVAIILPVVMSVVTGDGGFTTPMLVVAAYSVIQFVDNNLLVPRIVSSKVDVNAFVTIIAVFLGGALWGVPGMFLAIPFLAVCKIVFDRIDSMKPWGKLLGVKQADVPSKVVEKVDAQAAKKE